MKRPTRILITAACIAIAVGGSFVLLRGLRSGRSDPAYVTRPVAYADISSSVTETGTVNPMNEVQVGSQVSGTIATLNVDYNSVVRKGEVLAALDPTSFQAAVSSAQASLHLANANLSNARVAVQKAKVEYDLAQLTMQRDLPLVKQSLLAQSQLDADTAAAEAAYQDYLSAQGSVQIAQAQVTVAQGQLSQAQYNLDCTIIKSPIDGIVLDRSVSVGQSVAASLQAPTLFILATNLTDLEVDTSVDEADVGSVRSGQAAQIVVNAFPNVVFQGKVEQVRVNPTVVQNVVTYDAVVTVHDVSGRLLPGMTAQVTIETGMRTHVPTVPLAALLYQPQQLRTGGASQRYSGAGGRSGFGTVGAPSGRGAPGGQTQGASPPVAGAPGSVARVWVLRAGAAEPAEIKIGLSDSRNVEITSGPLSVGDEVIIAEHRGGGARAYGRTGSAGQGGSAGGPSGR